MQSQGVERWTFNGVDASTGAYLLEASPGELVRVASKTELDPEALVELRARLGEANRRHLGVKAGVDVGDLSATGWGVVFPAVLPGSSEARRQAAIREALAPLLEHRRAAATRQSERRYREYLGPAGLRPQESKLKFLARHGAGPGPVDPEVVPYYLLLVGEPRELPFRFQSQLGVQYAVGRICFDSIEEYAHYAECVVAAERQALSLPRRLTFFSVANADDGATQASARALVGPLLEGLSREPALAGWAIEALAGEAATREALAGLLSGGDAPALLFTASHGLGFPRGDPRQLPHQGALLCQDWPGPRRWGRQPIPESHYFAGDHLPSAADLRGTVAFHFACYGAGTPEHDEFAAQALRERAQIAPYPFVAALPKAMLGRPGGALAVIGHVDRAWGHSFLGVGSGAQRPQITVFASALQTMMQGLPIGAAMDYFDERYAELASDLSVELEKFEFGEAVDERALAALWTANNDARGYAILGDPAVRVRTAADAPATRTRVTIERTPHVVEMGGPAPTTPTPAPAPAAAPTHPDPTELPEFEVTTRGVDASEIRTRGRLGGDLVSTFTGPQEPSAAQREHHEALVRAALNGQARVLEALLKPRKEP